ncbi:uncharacterized protein LOC116303678 [Actinia tenebrosa]|uniref:Uncharacterized protein LOC116303678 n=1 Tax=Actinia tenebrosa TaxID=6105 RepID=A0A6P8IQC3_ACTTE|nr:uncharacterized protein LOC116303678 [Actinia tenebrosa]
MKFHVVFSGKKKCNESLARSCYVQFNGNVTHICKEVKELHHCLEGLWECHVMKHPSYALSKSILDEHRRCFFVNYSKILEILDKKSEPTKTKHPINSTTEAKIEEIETSTNFLPVTFVVVATVCTCLFLIILVVFSVVRHTSLLRRQRHSTVERPPIRLQISPCRTSQRTRRSLRRNGRRNRHRHMYVIHEARQTVSGFFEGNVPPPPYSAVLDETESIRAGDLPPPYQPQPFVAIGVIV